MATPQIKAEIRFDTVGLSKLSSVLRNLPQRSARRIILGGVSAASQAYLSVIRRETPKLTGGLRKSWFKKTKWYPGSLTAFGIVKTRWPGGAHVHLVESGTKERFTSGGARRGRMPAIGPVARARRSADERVRSKMAEAILKNAEKEITKAIHQ